MRVENFDQALQYFDDLIKKAIARQPIESVQLPHVSQELSSERLLLLQEIFNSLDYYAKSYVRDGDGYDLGYILTAEELIEDFRSGKLGLVVDVCIATYTKDDSGGAQNRSIRYIIHSDQSVEFVGLKDRFLRDVEAYFFDNHRKVPQKILGYSLIREQKTRHFDGLIERKNYKRVKTFSEAIRLMEDQIDEVRKDKNFSKQVYLPISRNFSDEQEQLLITVFERLEYRSYYMYGELVEDFGNPDLAREQIEVFCRTVAEHGFGEADFHDVGYLSSDRSHGRSIRFFEKNGEVNFLGLDDDFRKKVEKYFTQNHALPEKVGDFLLNHDEISRQYIWKNLNLTGRKIVRLDGEDMENAAAKIHDIWSRWYLHMKDNFENHDFSKRKDWDLQAKTHYVDLSEEDKEKDRQILREIFDGL